MIIKYQPAGSDTAEVFDTRRLKVSETQIIERTLDMSWPGVRHGLRNDSPSCMRAVAWVMCKRTRPDLRWSQFDPEVDELSGWLDMTEVRAAADAIASVTDADDDEREHSYAIVERSAFDTAAAAAYIKELREGPKEPASAPGSTAPEPDSPATVPPQPETSASPNSAPATSAPSATSTGSALTTSTS